MNRASFRALQALARSGRARVLDSVDTDGDRAWFDAHPRRSLRMRWLAPEERTKQAAGDRLAIVSRGLSAAVWQALAPSMQPRDLVALDAPTSRSWRSADFKGFSEGEIAQVIRWADELVDDGPLRALLGGGR